MATSRCITYEERHRGEGRGGPETKGGKLEEPGWQRGADDTLSFFVIGVYGSIAFSRKSQISACRQRHWNGLGYNFQD